MLIFARAPAGDGPAAGCGGGEGKGSTEGEGEEGDGEGSKSGEAESGDGGGEAESSGGGRGPGTRSGPGGAAKAREAAEVLVGVRGVAVFVVDEGPGAAAAAAEAAAAGGAAGTDGSEPSAHWQALDWWAREPRLPANFSVAGTSAKDAARCCRSALPCLQAGLADSVVCWGRVPFWRW